MTTSPEAVAMSQDLKRRGWSVVGPTAVHSFMGPWVWSTNT